MASSRLLSVLALLVVQMSLVNCYQRPDNLANKKPTQTTPPAAGKKHPAGFEASKAVDGDRTTTFSATKSCFMSVKAPEAVWSVDLQGLYNVRTVLLVNNEQKFFYGRTMKIMLTDKYNPSSIWASNYTIIGDQVDVLLASQIKAYRCPKKTCMARYVVILKQPASFEEMIFTEIEVYDTNTLENLALQTHSVASTGKDGKYLAANANDGLPGSKIAENSCYQSVSSPDMDTLWWRTDLGRNYQVRKITVTTPSDCCREQFNNMYFKVTPEFGTDDEYLHKYRDCEYSTGFYPTGNLKDFFCKRRTVGRYVVLVKRNAIRNPMSFCEVEVWGHVPEKNYAQDGKTFQSDLVGTTNTSSDQGADGNINPDFNDFSCVETPGKQKVEWWAVDVGSVIKVRNVIIVNRLDCCGKRLKNFKVLVKKEFDPTDVNKGKSVVCHEQKGALPAGHVKPLYCPTAPVGKYVVVMKEPATGDPLSFCELEVYGSPFDGNLAYGKPTNQRSTYWNYNSELAVDGEQEGTCSQALTVEPNAGVVWFHVDLEEDFDIDKLVIVNKRDCGNFCLRDFYIYISATFDKSNVNPRNYTLCHHQISRLKSAERKFIKCQKSIIGGHVIIIASGSYPLTICEIEVYESSAWENVAINKPTIQSSDMPAGEGASSAAVDGSRMTDYSLKSCSHTTGMDPEEWWSVDLGKILRIRRIVVVNREDAFAFRLRDFRVLVAKVFVPGKLASSDVTMCYEQQHAMAPGEVKDVNCNQPTYGRYVIITKTAKSPLSLCEVEVFGSPAELNLALMKRALQSGETDVTKSDRLSSRAVDGNTDNNVYGGSCTETPGKEDEEWWSVDLQNVYHVRSVVVYNRGDCCGNRLRNFRVAIAMLFDRTKMNRTIFTVCHSQLAALTTGEMKRMDCKSDRAVGRHVIIVKEGAKGDPLQFCEVEVFGTDTFKVKENRAKGMTPSSQTGGKSPGAALDGDPNPNPGDGSCFVSSGDYDVTWWAVDLKASYEVEFVTISSNGSDLRMDILASAKFITNNLQLLYPALTYKGPTTTTVAPNTTAASTTTPATPASTTTPMTPATLGFDTCRRYKGRPFSGEILDIKCLPKTIGQHVWFVKLSAHNAPLVLCEVEVHGKLAGSTTSSTPKPTTPPPTTPPPTTQAATPSPEPPTDIAKPIIACAMAAAVIGCSVASICVLKKKFAGYGLLADNSTAPEPQGPRKDATLTKPSPVDIGDAPPPGMPMVE